MDFRITGLSPEPFLPFFAISDAELVALGMRRHVVDQHPGFPDRITLEDAALGSSVLF